MISFFITSSEYGDTHLLSSNIHFLLTMSCSHTLSLFLFSNIFLFFTYSAEKSFVFCKMLSPMLIGFGCLVEVGVGFVQFSFDSLR